MGIVLLSKVLEYRKFSFLYLSPTPNGSILVSGMQSGCEWILDSILRACVGIVATLYVKTCNRWAGIPDLTELPMESTARSPSVSLSLSLYSSLCLVVCV